MREIRTIASSPIPTITLPSGEKIPAFGQGTWGLAENRHSRNEEMAALRLGLDLGLTLIDTAEMYADGGAEKLVGEAIAGRRDDVFLVTKVYPHNATRKGTIAACERSLKRLATDRIDLYLLHWRGGVPLAETLDVFSQLVKSEKIRHWGVSNFDVDDMEELTALAGGSAAETNQVLYNLLRRGIEFDLVPWCQVRGIPIMAYSPIEQGRMLKHPVLAEVAARHGATPAQVALGWLLCRQGLIVIPKAGTQDHVRENRAALNIRLTKEDQADLDRAFPRPTQKKPLDML